jgi:electron-transferring-flavoprotein dehydrogenase
MSDQHHRVDVLYVGAGPASLASAIRLKQLLNGKGSNESVVVIEKADKPGQHNLSGAVFEADVLDGLIPDWRKRTDSFVVNLMAGEVKKDDVYFLAGSGMSLRLPGPLVPSYLRHRKNNYAISISELVRWLTEVARGLGVEVYTGFAAKEVMVQGDAVIGVMLGDKGLDKDGGRLQNYLAGERLEARVTVLGEGSLGQLAEDVVKRFGLAEGRNTQIHSLGVKEIIRLPEKNSFGSNHVLHSFGFPNRMSSPDVFGGGAVYSMGANQVAVSLILALDWRYSDLNPQQELQVFKSHRLIKKLLEGGEVISYGAKTLPEGGYYSVPRLATNGAMIIGDDAGLTNVRKLKGLHYAIKSGMVAADAILQALEKQDFSEASLGVYQEMLEKSFVMKDLYKARNYRQVFAKAWKAGLFLGAPLSVVQQLLPGRLATKADHEGLKKGARLNRTYAGGIDRLSAVSLSGTTHREDEPSHITFAEDSQDDGCFKEFGCHPCAYFCPAEVYRFEADKLILSPSNCVHCQTCRVKCPRQVIRWRVPEGGDGPKYKMM